MEGELNGDPIRHLKNRIDGLEKKVSELRPKPLAWDIDQEVMELRSMVARLDTRLAWIEQEVRRKL